MPIPRLPESTCRDNRYPSNRRGEREEKAMYTNRDKQVELRPDQEPGAQRIIAPPELSVDGMVTHLTKEQELVLRCRAARQRERGW